MNRVASDLDWRAGQPLTPKQAHRPPSPNEPVAHNSTGQAYALTAVKYLARYAAAGTARQDRFSPCRRLSTVRAGSGAIPLVTQ